MVIAKNIVYDHKAKENIICQVIEVIEEERMCKLEVYDYKQITPMKIIMTFDKFIKNYTYTDSWYHMVDEHELAYDHQGVVV